MQEARNTEVVKAVFTLRNAKIVAFQEFLDSAAYNAAFASVPA